MGDGGMLPTFLVRSPPPSRPASSSCRLLSFLRFLLRRHPDLGEHLGCRATQDDALHGFTSLKGRFGELFAQEWATFPAWIAKATQEAELNLDTPAAQIASHLPQGLHLAEQDPQGLLRGYSAVQRAVYRLIVEMVHAHWTKQQ